ncbi:MAG: hypothetical protein IKP19_03765 [Oscillospiraceae bacterium]|nr:hypothetical protein [Oscillospiraceae bacterium]
MDQPSQFHMTVVTRKRREGPSGSRQSPAPGPNEAGQHSQAEERRHSGAHHHHGESHHHSGEHRSHRHYQDFGTVNLGTLTEQPDTQRESVPQAAKPVSEDAHRQDTSFSPEQYAMLLNRKFRKRKSSRLSIVLLVVGVLLVISIMLFVFFRGRSGSSDEGIETLEPLESFDLGDLDE